MLKRGFLTTVAAMSLMAAAALPAQAEVSIMYPEWIASLVEPGIAWGAAKAFVHNARHSS